LSADEPLVTLQWGLYAFVPSLAALQELRACAEQRLQEDAVLNLDEPPPCTDPALVSRLKARRAVAQGALAAQGAALIARLRQVERAAGQDAALEQWKTVLEDAGARAAGLQPAVWAAVRQVHGGVLRTPYGVLVASGDLVQEVFTNAGGRYSVSGYNVRLARSFGEIYLGRDQSPAYCSQAKLANDAIMGITREDAFDLARFHTALLLLGWAPPGQECTLELRDLTDGLLERLCRHWFGLPDGLHVQAGGWHQQSAAHAACPGHFYAPSRYTFQPHPGEAVREMGKEHGQKLHKQVTDFVQAVHGLPFLQGSLGRKLFTALLPPAPAALDFERLSSTLIGVMMGFLPTVDGVLRGLLHEWVQEGTLWEHQAALSRAGGAKASFVQVSAVLEEPMRQSMHRRPVPELVWRTVVEPHALGAGGNAVDLRAGDRVVVGIASALQQALAEGRTELQLLFGGDRRSPTPAVPLHACPGQDMAMGVMLGFLAVLLSHTAALRPASSPQALRFGP
jgi:cytochrome P450